MKGYIDTELWDNLREGDKSAFQKIYDRESSYLYNYGKKIFQDTNTVEDCIHDLFIDIWHRHDKLGPTDSIRKYLAASLRRRIINTLKKLSKSQSVESFDQINFDPELAIDDIIINKELDTEKSQKLKKAFETLTSRQKEILFLRFYQGLDYEQIAEVVGIQYQSLRNTLSASIKKLRSEMIILLTIILIFF